MAKPTPPVNTKESMDTKQKTELEKKIGEQIDFLSDHWVNGDDKPPFSFGGWRDEVVADLVEMFSQLEQEARADERKKVEDMLWTIHTDEHNKEAEAWNRSLDLAIFRLKNPDVLNQSKEAEKK